MLKQMRSNTKWIMVIVIVGFVGMIVLQWGMNIGSRQPGGLSGSSVGSVNGTEVKRDVYNQIFDSQVDMLGSRQRITLDQTRRIHEEVWNYFVTNILIEQEINARGITYSDQELLNYMMNTPVQGADQVSIFMENDTFSLVKYQDFITNPQNLTDPQARQYIDMIEAQAISTLPRNKLLESLQNSVVVSEHAVREQWLIENEERKIDYLYINTSDLQAYEADVSRDEALAYYESHQEAYTHDELRSLDAIFFSLAPTPGDTLEVIERANLLAERAKSGEDFSELADSYSDDPGNDAFDGSKNGGDLGYFGRNRMAKEFEDVAFSLKPGEVSDAFKSQFGYHIVKVDSLKYNEDNSEIDQVKARHILMKIEASAQTQDAVSNKITAFTESVTGGADFDALAQSDSLEITTTTMFVDGAMFIQGVGSNTKMLAKRAFIAKLGEVLPVYMTDFGYYIFKVADIEKAGVTPFDEIQNIVIGHAKREKQKQYAADYNAKLIGHIEAGKTLGVAQKAVGDTLIIVEANTAAVSRNSSIPGLGMMNTLMASVFTLEDVGDNTGTVASENGNGVAVLLEKLPLDESMYEDEKAQIRTKLETEIRNSVMNLYINNLMEEAEINDDRHLFYGNL
jgi:peptidyl-prolyl cis-trans isomerase D